MPLLPTDSNVALRRILRHAYENVPFYQRLYDSHGVHPDDIRSIEDLTNLPITSKTDLQRTPDEMLARHAASGQLITRHTSGVTGQPVMIRTSPADEIRRHLARWRVDFAYGVRPGDRRVRLRLPRPYLGGDRLLLATLKAFRLYAQTKVDCRLPGSELLAEIRRFRPTLIDGHPGAIDCAAQAALDAGGASGVHPRYILTGGEMLTPAMRERITTAFKTPVYDIYGANEIGIMAYECAKTGLYHNTAGVIVEIIGKDGQPVGDGEEGEVVVTSLLTYATAFIRYRIGDRAMRGPNGCPCGAPVRTLGAIQGRVMEFFHLRDGRELHPREFEFWTLLWMRNYQLIQETEDHFRLRLVLAPEATPAKVEELYGSMSAILGTSASLTFEIVETLNVGPNGKRRMFEPLSKSVGAGQEEKEF